VLIFGRPVIGHLSKVYIGGGTDPLCHIWAIAWWPFAIAHAINPLIAHTLWAPEGYNLVWATGIPAPSLAIYPVTRFFGPVVSYNLLCLVAPAAAAAAAFLLCRYACGRFWPALLGGYIFGFSPYMLSQMLAHLVLILVFPVPLMVYITSLRINASIGRTAFVTILVAILLFQFLSSTEIFATATFFGASALLLFFLLADRESRSNLVGVTREIAYAYGVLGILLSPFLYYVFAPGLPIPPNPAAGHSNDLLTFVLPPPVLLIGSQLAVSKLRNLFETSVWWELSAYLGPGLWIVMWLFTRTYWRTRLGKFLILSFAYIAIMSLGPTMCAAGERLVAMPWRMFNALPLINEALPGRFGLYLFLLAAIAASVYLAASSEFVWSGWLLAGLSVLFIAPELAIWRQIGQVPAFVSTPGQTLIDVPRLFSSTEYKKYLAPNDNVLILPLGTGSTEGLLWQAQSDFYFNIIDWFGAIPPHDSARWPIMTAFRTGHLIGEFPEQLNGFLGAHQVKAIIVDPRAPGPWPGLLTEMGMSATAVGGVLLYKVPVRVLVAYRAATVHLMAEQYARASFAALVSAASRYSERGFPLAKLGPGEAQRLKFLTLPENAMVASSQPNWWQDLWLGSLRGRIGVGIAGNYEDLRVLVDDYGPEAAEVFFPFPKRLAKRPRRGDGLLLITFTPEGLRRAAQMADRRDR
jgi:hypothetical protein